MSVCCVLSGRGLCDEVNTHPEKSYRLWCVVVCDLEISLMRSPWLALGCSTNKKNVMVLRRQTLIDLPVLFIISALHCVVCVPILKGIVYEVT